MHGGGFKTYAQARLDRIERLEELRRRWDEEHEKIKELVRMYRVKASHNSDMASRLQAAVTRLAKFEEAGPPEEPPREQHIKVRLKGARTGRRAVMVEDLAVNGTTQPFCSEIWFGDRVAVLGGNGSGKSTFLRLLAGEPLPHVGRAPLGARVVLAVTHDRWFADSFDRFLVFAPDGTARESQPQSGTKSQGQNQDPERPVLSPVRPVGLSVGGSRSGNSASPEGIDRHLAECADD